MCQKVYHFVKEQFKLIVTFLPVFVADTNIVFDYNLVAPLMVCMLKKKKIYPPYVSKHNSNSEKQVILLKISNGEGWHYLAVKNYQHY